MDFAQERQRIKEREAWGARTHGDWNEYNRQWDLAHPIRAKLKKIGGIVLLIVLSAITWLPMLTSIKTLFE